MHASKHKSGNNVVAFRANVLIQTAHAVRLSHTRRHRTAASCRCGALMLDVDEGIDGRPLIRQNCNHG